MILCDLLELSARHLRFLPGQPVQKLVCLAPVPRSDVLDEVIVHLEVSGKGPSSCFRWPYRGPACTWASPCTCSAYPWWSDQVGGVIHPDISGKRFLTSCGIRGGSVLQRSWSSTVKPTWNAKKSFRKLQIKVSVCGEINAVNYRLEHFDCRTVDWDTNE